MKDWIKLFGLGVCFLVLAGGVPAGLTYLERKHRDSFDKLRCTCHFTNVVDTAKSAVDTRTLPSHIKIQRSSGGRYRWIAYSDKWPDGWASVFDYDSEEGAIAGYWSQHEFSLKRQNWTNITP